MYWYIILAYTYPDLDGAGFPSWRASKALKLKNKNHRCWDPTSGLQNQNLQRTKSGCLYFLKCPECNVQLWLRKPASRHMKVTPVWHFANKDFPGTGITHRPNHQRRHTHHYSRTVGGFCLGDHKHVIYRGASVGLKCILNRDSSVQGIF